MKTFRVAFVAILVVLAAAYGTRAADDNKLPAEVAAILEKADTVELLSLQPKADPEAKDSFHQYKILGKTTLKGADATKLVATVQKGIKDSDGTIARCFNPRHGLRASFEGKTAELVICYECNSIECFIGDKRVGTYTATTSTPGTELNKILTAAKAPLPDK